MVEVDDLLALLGPALREQSLVLELQVAELFAQLLVLGRELGVGLAQQEDVLAVPLDGSLQKLNAELGLPVALPQFPHALTQHFLAPPLVLVDLADLLAVALLDAAYDGVVVAYHLLRLLVLPPLFLHLPVLPLQLDYYRNQALQSCHHFLEGLRQRLLLGVDEVLAAEKELRGRYSFGELLEVLLKGLPQLSISLL